MGDFGQKGAAAAGGVDQLADVLPLVKDGFAGALPAPGHRLPAFWSSFVGREAELAELTDLLDSARLVTLVGPGGMGKTRLAVEVAFQVAAGRAFFVDLAPVHDGALVAEEVAAAFSVGELRGRDLAEVLAAEVPGSALLVLDNCEHLVAACADVVHRLLRGCRGLRILATSQQRLKITGECVWRVPALAVPAPALELEPGQALRCAAVQLFCQRAEAVSQAFAGSPVELGAVVEICRRLDGNPLAIELAAACADVLPPSEIAARLEDRFGLLQGGDCAGPARHQTLAAALAWSDELLSTPERALLRRLSVFEGGFSLIAAEVVCGGGPVDANRVLPLLSSLVSKSLVAAEPTASAARYRLLETVRHHAAAGLEACGEAFDLGERHALWCLELTEQAATVDDMGAWLTSNQLGPENVQDNGRAALEWCLAHRRHELALRLAAGQMEFWQDSGRFAEAREWLERVMAVSESAPPSLRARALHDAGFASFMLGDFDAAKGHITGSLELWEESGDIAGAERTRGLLGFISTFGPGPIGVEELEADLPLIRSSGDDGRLAEALVGCSHARLFRGEAAAAYTHFEELVAVAGRAGCEGMVASGLVGLGSACLRQGEYERAEGWLRQGVAAADAAGQAHCHAVGRNWLAELARLTGDAAQAGRLFDECLVENRTLGAPYPLAHALLGQGRVLLDQGEAEQAVVPLEESVAIAEQAGLGHLVGAGRCGLAEAALALGDVEAARERLDAAQGAASDCGDKEALASITFQLAEVARLDDELPLAGTLHHSALQQRREIGDRAGVVDSLDALADLAVSRGELEVAARLFGATEALRSAGCFPRPLGRRDAYDRGIEALSGGLAFKDLEKAWAEGSSLTFDDALAYASRGRGPRNRPASGPDSLTPAERDVAALAADGLSNSEIAERQFVSPRTVQSHLRSIYAKLNVSSRRELRDAWRQA